MHAKLVNLYDDYNLYYGILSTKVWKSMGFQSSCGLMNNNASVTGKENPILIPISAQNHIKTLFFCTYREKKTVLFPITLWQILCEENFWKKNLVTKTLKETFKMWENPYGNKIISYHSNLNNY